MNLKLKKMLSITLLLCSATMMIQADCTDCGTECCSGCVQSQNLWQPHAFSVSMSREIMLEKPAWIESEHQSDEWHGTLGIGFEYMSNWGEANKSACCTAECSPSACCKSLGSVPFWASDKGNVMTVGNNSNSKDLDAYQLGLGPLTDSDTGAIRLDPKVFQTGADYLFYIGAHKTERGFWAKVHGPVGVISIDPRLCEPDTITPTTYPAGALTNAANDTQTVEPIYKSVTEAFAGGKSYGDVRAMKKGLIGCKRTSSATFGDLEVSVGYNLLADEDKHLGIAVRFSAPTGNKATGTYILEPVFGRNGHWGAGGEIIGHWKVWESDTDEKHLNIWFNGTAQHLFNSKHNRTFDLKGNGLGSKYLLLAKYTGVMTAQTSAASVANYQNEIQNAVNLTCLPIESSFGVEGNFALMFDYHFDCWNFGLGYEGWGRSCEKLKVNCACPGSTNLNDYAVIGRQRINDGGTMVTMLGYGQPTAKIGASEAALTTADAPTSTIKFAGDPANRLPEDPNDTLDICGQRAHAAFTSKVFAQLGRTWTDCDYLPYIAISGGAEFVHTDNNAVRFWSAGAQGGFSF